MKKTDLVTGVKHTAYVYGRDIGFLAGFTVLVLVAVLITGGSLWTPVACLILTVLRTASTVTRSVRNVVEARHWYEWWLENNPEATHVDD